MSILRSVYNRAVTRFSRMPNASGRIELLLSTLHHHGIRTLPFPAVFRNDAVYLPPATSTYPAARLARRSLDAATGIERWWIESPAMRREVQVQILRLGDPNISAPTLLLLDGSSAPTDNGWIGEGHIADTLTGEHAVVVMPTEASGSHYADWRDADPLLGRMKWETFLCTELLSVLQLPENGLNTNGVRIIGGLSMGAGAAVRLANTHPNLFHGVIGISGCYSTTDPVGWEYHNAITRCVGGNTRHLWDAETRARADVARNPEGLRNTAVYLFTADGRITDRDLQFHTNRPFQELLGAVLLEFASWCCTERLDAAMSAAGMQNYRVVYQRGGVHDWIYCAEQLRAGWDWIMPRITPA
ncbi:alpha/beta hydrolase family protein [Corynebacterium sp.]|uniref:alpha/beta hydrolase n=1 Tax=Corynebacterium sp. TaxID=1720 RepID=UPI0026DBF8B6|nr:alpha/beta hydrolase family protein [Corynebacterium sp.]MDO5076092.1 alpha/beta hydrolase family protein [Corynebacterium sp.]